MSHLDKCCPDPKAQVCRTCAFGSVKHILHNIGHHMHHIDARATSCAFGSVKHILHNIGHMHQAAYPREQNSQAMGCPNRSGRKPLARLGTSPTSESTGSLHLCFRICCTLMHMQHSPGERCRIFEMGAQSRKHKMHACIHLYDMGTQINPVTRMCEAHGLK